MPPELDAFVATGNESGRFESAIEVVREEVRTVEQDEREQEQEAKLRYLQRAIDEGFASGIAERNPFDRILSRLRSENQAH